MVSEGVFNETELGAKVLFIELSTTVAKSMLAKWEEPEVKGVEYEVSELSGIGSVWESETLRWNDDVASVTVEEVDGGPFCNKAASDMLLVTVGRLLCVFNCGEFVILLSINDNEEGTGVKPSRIVLEVHGVLKVVSLEEAATLEVIDEEFPGSEKDDKTKIVPQAFVSMWQKQLTLFQK